MLFPNQKWQELPPLLLYPRLIPHVIRLCFRYRVSPAVIMSANPVFRFGGLPFDSKFDGLQLFSNPFYRMLKCELIRAESPLEERLSRFSSFMNGAHYPVILKPDTGHRGIDVHKVTSFEEAHAILLSPKWDYIVQEFSTKPLEFGVFYCRIPGEANGQIVSLTQKTIPVITGDGVSTIGRLIDASELDKKDHFKQVCASSLHRVLASGEPFPLLTVASHNQGAVFTDLSQWDLSQLTATFNQICAQTNFYFGRFDVRADSFEALASGEFDTIEVNGATAEFIHVYDDEMSFEKGISELRRQWSLLFQVSAAARLHHPTLRRYSIWEFIRLYLDFFKQTRRVTGRLW